MSGDETLEREYRRLYGTFTGVKTIFTTIPLANWVFLELRKNPLWEYCSKRTTMIYASVGLWRWLHPMVIWSSYNTYDAQSRVQRMLPVAQ